MHRIGIYLFVLRVREKRLVDEMGCMDECFGTRELQ
jgi:hypothetical protein